MNILTIHQDAFSNLLGEIYKSIEKLKIVMYEKVPMVATGGVTEPLSELTIGYNIVHL